MHEHERTSHLPWYIDGCMTELYASVLEFRYRGRYPAFRKLQYICTDVISDLVAKACSPLCKCEEMSASMVLILSPKHHLSHGRALSYRLSFILPLLFLCVNAQDAIGSESPDGSLVSLTAKNQPLGDVLEGIAQVTGYRFNLNDHWRTYPVSVSVENIPLHQGLTLILRGLNHAIVYGSDKDIMILVYGKVDSRKAVSYSLRSPSSQIEDDQEPTPSSESSAEETDALTRPDDGSEGTAEDELPESPQEQN